ncbi:unnamed protein product [Blepharisma stoltei]|uniref:Uncharacterized protein n=1 Tax=Blepharisma stoltei TaxID=1481888 RepID=A0AAU9J6M6_9CILI|nr:unnamed protein product [Blepharisma stoltei]
MSAHNNKVCRSISVISNSPLGLPTFNQTPISLAPDFALSLLNKELEAQKNCSIQVIQELVNLYRQAIEYYEFVNDQKFMYYQDRLHKFLVRPDILHAMQQENERLKITRATNRKPRSRATTIAKLQPVKSNPEHRNLTSDEVKAIIPPVSPKKINKIMTKNEDETKIVTSKTANDFKTQDLNLEERLINRRQRSSNTSLNSSFNQDSCSPDKRVQIPYDDLSDNEEETRVSSRRSSSISVNQINNELNRIQQERKEFSPEVLEKRLEEIMEKHFCEKTERIAEIKVKYEREMQRLSESGLASRGKMNEIRRLMNEEIEAVNAALEFSKQGELLKLKEC